MAHPYGIEGEALEIVAAAKKVADEVIGGRASETDGGARFPAENLRALGERGLMGLCLPKSVGGKGQPPRTFIAVAETLAEACGSTAMIYVMHVVGAQMIAASSTLQDRDALLREIAEGRHLTTLALSEKGSRSQFWMPVSRLSQDKDGYVTNAYKSWVTAAHHAHSFVSSAQRPGGNGPMDSTLYLLRAKGQGIRVAADFDGLGLRGNDSAPVSVESYHVPERDLITPNGKGLEGMLTVILPWFAAGTSAMANGLSRAALAAAQKHMTSTAFETGGGLRELPTLRARLAEMSAMTDAARALLGYTVREMEAPNEMTPLFVLESRLVALETAVEVTDRAMKACGGAAFSKHMPLERLFRDARAGWVMAPTVDHLKEFVGRALTGLPIP